MIILLISYTHHIRKQYIFFFNSKSLLKIEVYEMSLMHGNYYYLLVYLLFIITYLFWYFFYWTISITVKFMAQIISNSFQWEWADRSKETDLSLNSVTVVGSIHVTAWMLHTAHTRQKKIIKNFYRTPIQNRLCEITYCSNSNILCIIHTADKQKKRVKACGGDERLWSRYLVLLYICIDIPLMWRSWHYCDDVTFRSCPLSNYKCVTQ